MLTVDDYATIRVAHRDGMSIREIASTFHHSRRKVREILAQPVPTGYTRTKAPPAPVLGSFHPTIDALLAADEDAPPKQRHTAMQIFRRLRDEHAYQGGPIFFVGRGLTFINCGSDLYYAAGLLHHFTGEAPPLVWAKRLNERFLEMCRRF